jgi:O-antigen/teichoic acid export membrane protein
MILLTAPFAFFAIFQRAYMYFDTVMLSRISGDYYVGIYQVPFKIIFALQFLPMAFTASLYPAMSSYWVGNKEQLVVSFERAMNYLIIISLPIAAGTIALSDVIIKIFKSGYDDSIAPLNITMLALLFIFVNFPIGSLLNACEKQKYNTIYMGIVTVSSLVLNFFLISKYQAIGASLTVFFTNFLMFFLGINGARKIVGFRFGKIILVFAKSLCSSLLMAFFVFLLKPYFNILILVLGGGVIYFFIQYFFGAFKKEDVLSIYNAFIKKTV